MHVWLVTPQAAERAATGGAVSFPKPCRLCREQRAAGKAASQPEIAARQAAPQQLAAAGINGGIAAEVRLLKETNQQRYAAADVVVYCHRPCGQVVFLLVQADGTQHFEEQHAFPGQTVAAQQERDAAFNAAAAAQQLSVARLHHADQEEYGAVLAGALQLLLASSRPFALFSRSYGGAVTLDQPYTIKWH